MKHTLTLLIILCLIGLFLLTGLDLPVIGQERYWSSSRNGADITHRSTDFPKEWTGLSPSELARLKVTWEPVKYGSMNYIDMDGNRIKRWKDAPAETRYLAPIGIQGRLTIVSEDGKTETPVRAFYPVRVLLAKRGGNSPDWTKGHNGRDTSWNETVTEGDGRFLAEIDPSKLQCKPGVEEKFQLGLCLGTGKYNELRWTGDTPVFKDSITTVPIIGPRVLSPIQRAISDSPSPRSPGFNPAALIHAVNVLQPLGKEQAIAELRAFLKIAPRSSTFAERLPSDINTADPDCVFLIVRLLFEPEDAGEKLPVMMIGAPGGINFGPLPEEDPIFPLTLSNGFPFILVNGYALAGHAQPSSQHLDWAEKHGKLRAGLMTTQGTPKDAAEALVKKFEWKPNGPGAKDLLQQAAKAAQTMKDQPKQ